jgi:hypothetical protein
MEKTPIGSAQSISVKIMLKLPSGVREAFQFKRMSKCWQQSQLKFATDKKSNMFRLQLQTGSPGLIKYVLMSSVQLRVHLSSSTS